MVVLSRLCRDAGEGGKPVTLVCGRWKEERKFVLRLKTCQESVVKYSPAGESGIKVGGGL